MQGGYGGGVYPAPPIPPDYPSLYGGSSTTSYGGSAPSAPAYTPAAPPAAPAYHQPVPSSNSSPASGAYNSQFAPEYNQSYNSPSNSYVPSMPNPDASNNQPSYSNSYPPSYAPAVPSYPAVVPAYDRSFEFGLGSAPTSTSFDSSAPSQRSNYGNASFGAAPQPVGPPAGYESYSNQGLGGYSQSGDGDSGRFDMYGHPTGYGRSESVHPSNGGGSDRSYDNGGFRAVYAYDGGGVEPYGARGSGGDSWSSSGSSYNFQNEFSSSKPYNVARAAPKSDEDSDSGGIQKFRVKLLPETRSSDSVKDVICQIGLDGVRMVDPSTNRTLRIYPLVTITRWEVMEPSVFTFWAKSSVDVDPRTIQLQSNTYTTTAILDTLTAACVQRHEMVKDEATDSGTSGGGSVGNDPNTAKKSSVLDWVALRPRAANPEEKQHWVPDELVTKCTSCDTDFGAFLRRHHCRNCGEIFCDKCTRGRIALNTDEDSQPVRVCDRCLAEITQRMENPKPNNAKLPALRTHEDLAKKLQEELERNNAGRKPALGRSSSSGAASSGQSTSVVNCSKCGSITLVTGRSTRCSNCETSTRSAAPARRSPGFSGSAAPHGPPHLWATNTPASDGPGPRMREVACPTCTVHLQVQVPSFGTETVECGVCQHPFLVAA
ncbi:hypothetical protein MPTK1_6g06950 [Marchantia polymorpha subsp. ruderalis]|uniref:FYVE-type domain-containing protein n=2 Tax=Marchantia polymorpha TaxID=3197 RepID=A0AAF6BPB7_MARPO|nr:hypothetical protein MARPO_0053s0010 [Marchantia polymorpha]BBN13851.1 hypothetical protein Mp_6g06950 [Marchantia polymorpha subsp. ruderalis]|eukprot:PTQ38053.1 hypothetical protein MARPO_0053s0010 [Marchantia polymorpha]